MTKAELAMLEKVFSREVEAALNKWPHHLFHSRGQIAARLATDGYLQYRIIELPDLNFGRIHVDGYELTHLGRLAYCMTCDDAAPTHGATAPDGPNEHD